jgi:hypothetical protein
MGILRFTGKMGKCPEFKLAGPNLCKKMMAHVSYFSTSAKFNESGVHV